MTVDVVERKFSRHAGQSNVPAARLSCVLVALLMPAGILLDVLTEPAHALEFLRLRLLTSLVSLGILGLTFTRWGARHAFWVGAAPPCAASVAIAIMIERLGGYASPYYAGLSLCILGVGLVFRWTARQAALVCSIIVGIWLVPILAHREPIELGPFFNNLYFLVCTAFIAVASNATQYQLARREFAARLKLAEATRELREAVGKLQHLDRAKSRFFANVSHELRTPLTLILAPVEDLLQRPGSDEMRRLLGVVRSNAGRLLRLIDELLDLSRLDAGGLRLSVAAVDLRGLVDTIHRNSLPLAESNCITLAMDAPQAIDGIFGDAHRIESILSNLVGNALKYSRDGGRVWIRLFEADGGAMVEVEDDGPGIAQEDLPHVFERFFQANERRRHGGVGIGLALAKELAELHDGTLTVASVLGKGTVFRLWLPKGKEHFRPEVIERRVSFHPAVPGGRRSEDEGTAPDVMTPVPEEPDEDARGTRQTGHRVLVVEDRDELRSFIVSLLAGEFAVLEAADAEEGLRIAREQRPDLVLSDVMMPGHSGTHLCAQIKRDPKLAATPVILLTARVGSEATLEAYAHGADDFVAKPFHPRVLLARVRAQLRLRALALRLASQEKLAAIGTLAAGVAHEVRNPLNAMLNAANLLLEKELSPNTARRMLEVVADGAERIRMIVGALDTHARPAEAGALAPFDVCEGLEATLRLLAYRTEGLSIDKLFPKCALAIAPPGPMNQVFLNLIDNALRAGGRTLELAVRAESGFIVLAISDDGSGVPPEIADRIFDPFFTTRAPGEGTGLGLYLSRQIVLQAGGDLRLVSKGSPGTTFEIRLPAADAVRGRSAGRALESASVPAE
jgi:signal transduction histidine kinase